VSPVKYELGFYIPEDDILHSHCRENLKSYIALTGRSLYRRRNVSPVKHELGFYIPEDDILHSHCRENLKSYSILHSHRRQKPEIFHSISQLRHGIAATNSTGAQNAEFEIRIVSLNLLRYHKHFLETAQTTRRTTYCNGMQMENSQLQQKLSRYFLRKRYPTP
jgi:hypothetical protein